MKIAIVGTGNVAEKNYIPSLLQHSDVSLTCYSRTQVRAEAVAQKFGVKVASGLEALFADPPDAVFVLTGEQQRLAATQALLPFKPKRLFLEKPLVARNGQAHVTPSDFWDGKALLEQAQAAGSEVAMIFNYRFFDQSERARQIIAERDFGAVINAVALSHYATWSHCIDLILHFAGPVQQITAQQGQRLHAHGKGEAAADVTAAFRLENGGTGTILGSNSLNWGFPLFELTLNFERGRIHFRGLDQAMEVLDYQTNVQQTFTPSRDSSRWDKYAASFAKSISAYLDTIRAGTPPPVPGAAGLRELQFEAGLKQSVADQQPINLMETFPTNGIL